MRRLFSPGIRYATLRLPIPGEAVGGLLDDLAAPDSPVWDDDRLAYLAPRLLLRNDAAELWLSAEGVAGYQVALRLRPRGAWTYAAVWAQRGQEVAAAALLDHLRNLAPIEVLSLAQGAQGAATAQGAQDAATSTPRRPGAPVLEERADWDDKLTKVRQYQEYLRKGVTKATAAELVGHSVNTLERWARRAAALQKRQDPRNRNSTNAN